MDLNIFITNNTVSTEIYDKLNGFDFDIVNFPFLDGDVDSKSALTPTPECILPTVLRRWSLCYFMWLCVVLYGAFHVVFPCSLFPCFSALVSTGITSLGEESWSICFSCICLFILQTLMSVLSLFLLVSGVGCGL